MPSSSAPYLTGPALLDFLHETFPNRQVITSTEFRHFLNISPSTDLRMRNLGKYPRTICLPGVMRDPRILLVDLAVWLEQGGCPETEGVTYRKRGRGSDEWKKNHPPKAKSSGKPAPETAPAVSPEIPSETVSESISENVSEPPAEIIPKTPAAKTRKKASVAPPEAVAENRPDSVPQAQA